MPKTGGGSPAADIGFSTVAPGITFDATDMPAGALPADPSSGMVLRGTGAGAPTIQNGYIQNSVANSAGYTVVGIPRRPKKISISFRLIAGGGTDATSPTLCIAVFRRTQDLSTSIDLSHNISTTTAASIQKYVASEFTNITTTNLSSTLALSTLYTMSAEMNFQTGTLTMTNPDGTTTPSSDEDILTNWGRNFFVEGVEQANSPKVQIKTITVTYENTGSIEVPTPSSYWLPTSLIDATPAIAENVEGGRFRGGALSDQAGVLTSGQITFWGGMTLPAGVPINRLTFLSGTTAAVAPTNQWACLMDRNGRVLAVTADKTTEAWAADTAKSFSFSTAYTPTGPTPVYVGLMVKAGTTPSLAGVTMGSKVAWILSGGNIMAGTAAATGLTTPISADTTRRLITTPSASLAYVVAD